MIVEEPESSPLSLEPPLGVGFGKMERSTSSASSRLGFILCSPLERRSRDVSQFDVIVQPPQARMPRFLYSVT